MPLWLSTETIMVSKTISKFVDKWSSKEDNEIKNNTA